MRFALLLAAPLLVAAAGDMNVATFLQKADALKAKGAMALFSSDLGLLNHPVARRPECSNVPSASGHFPPLFQ